MALFGPKVTCLGCGDSYGAKSPVCPRCLMPQGQQVLPPVSAGGPAQLMRVYKGNHPTRAFAKEARILAHAGWVVSNQSQGGFNAYKIGKKEPTNITVIYGRVG